MDRPQHDPARSKQHSRSRRLMVQIPDQKHRCYRRDRRDDDRIARAERCRTARKSRWAEQRRHREVRARKPGLQIRISVNLNFELLNFKFELANLRTFLKLRTSPYRFPPIFKKCCILEKSRKNLANIWPKFSKNSAKFGKICKNLQKKQQNFQQFLTKILRLENGAKDCIV